MVLRTVTSAWFTACHCVDLCRRQSPSSPCLINTPSTESLHCLEHGRWRDWSYIALTSKTRQFQMEKPEPKYVIGLCVVSQGTLRNQRSLRSKASHDFAKNRAKAEDVTLSGKCLSGMPWFWAPAGKQSKAKQNIDRKGTNLPILPSSGTGRASLPLVDSLHILPGEPRMRGAGLPHHHSAPSPPEGLFSAEDNTDGRLGCVC